MKRITVVAVRGRCSAGLEAGDAFLLDGWRIASGNADRLCCVALASIVANASRGRTRDGTVYISCPDAGMGEGGNVIFALTSQCDHEQG